MSRRVFHQTPPFSSCPSGKRLLIALVLSCFATMLVLPGCSGCNKQTTQQLTEAEKKKKAEEEKKKKEEAQKPPFEKSLMKVLPDDDTQLLPGAKQGHWIAVNQTIKANETDFNGDLSFTPINKLDVPVDLPDTPFNLNLSRPINLPKGQPKNLEMTLFAPPTAGNTRMRGGLISQVGREVLPTIEEFRPIPPHEYSFVVLSGEPQRYSFLQFLHSVRAPSGGSMQDETFYHVFRPNLEKRVPLPESVLTWTGVAYVLWDEIDPALLSIEQQQAMLDWLHWGGQLIVSGPESLDLLRGSFLSPYLPVEGGDSIELSAEDLSLLSQDFSPHTKKAGVKPLQVGRPWAAVELKLPESVEQEDVLLMSLDEKPLVVEGRVGRGRVVVTAFRLQQSDLFNWPGFDSFFNACLLRRGPREYALLGGAFNQLQLDWELENGRRRDPQLITNFRLFSRDAGYNYSREATKIDETGSAILLSNLQEPSLGAWSDTNDVANAARDTLTEAAGIEIPDADFVVKVLSIYLVLIVPVNWLFFRLIGRVEWAWIAAVVIALAYAGLVIRLAQLDIGFARSKTELAVLEVQPGYERAHLTRYTALYTSLTSDYDMALTDRHAVALPFAIETDYIHQSGEVSGEVRYRQDKNAELSGYPVLSNRTGLIHSEEMLDLGGDFEYTQGVTESIPHGLRNNTERAWHNAAIVEKLSEKQRRVGWLGHVPAGATASAKMEEIDTGELLNWYQSNVLVAREEAAPEAEQAVPLNLIRLVSTCLRSGDFNPNDVRLVALMDDPEQQGLTGVTFSPGSRQARYGTVLLAHLRYAQEPPPRRDANAATDYKIKDTAPQFDFGPDGLPLEQEP